MKVGELKTLLEKWDDADEVEINVPVLAKWEEAEYCWCEILGIDDGFLGSGKPELCLIEAGKIIGEG